MPKVSICVPVYNVEQYIGRCIESLQSQTLKDIEIIVVNDCTLDKSMQIVDKYALSDHRIRIIEHDCNHGLMWTRRTGYMAATGEYITFCDSDDTMPENAIEVLYSQAIKHNADISSGNLRWIKFDSTSNIDRRYLHENSDIPTILCSLLKNEFSHNICSKLFRRSLLQDHQYDTFDKFINGEDGCLFYQVVPYIERIVHSQEPVYNYCQNNSSSTHVRYKRNNLDNILKANLYRIRVCSKYPILETLLFKRVSTTIINLYSDGYDQDGTLSLLLKKYALQLYADNVKILKYFGIKSGVKMLLKKYMH